MTQRIALIVVAITIVIVVVVVVGQLNRSRSAQKAIIKTKASTCALIVRHVRLHSVPKNLCAAHHAPRTIKPQESKSTVTLLAHTHKAVRSGRSVGALNNCIRAEYPIFPNQRAVQRGPR